MKKAIFEEVAKWVSQAWKEVSVQTLVSGFTLAGIISAGNEICSDYFDDEENGESSWMNVY